MKKNKMVKLYKRRINTPIGEMLAIATDEAICMLDFVDSKNRLKDQEILVKHYGATQVAEDSLLLSELEKQLREYFAKERKEFSLPLALVGTSFQEKVWKVLQTIPYGEVRSYKEQATAVGNPKGVRAVANANGKNRISIVIPCHRVIGSDGTLTGYASGIERKQFLLDLERSNV